MNEPTTAQADSLVTLHGDLPVTNTRVIAEKFGKRHDDVLKAARAVMADCPQEFNDRNFAAVEYRDGKGQNRPMYELTEKAFALVAMGFTGPRFTSWKIAFLEEFERRGAELSGRMLPRPGQVEALRMKRMAEALANELLRANPERRKLLRYRKMGLSVREIARLMASGSETVRRELALLEACGMLEVTPRLEAQRAVAELPWPAAGGHRRTSSLRKARRTRRPHLSDHDITLANDRHAVKDYFPI